MIEINDSKVAVVQELGLITNVCKLHNPQNGQIVYNVTIISNSGNCMFPITKELFEQWILSMGKILEELDGKQIIIPKIHEVRPN